MTEKHALLAPSASPRWVACPGSVALITSLPPEQRDSPPNIHTVRGNACHEVLAGVLSQDRSPASWLGHTVTEGDIVYTVTQEDIANVQLVVNYVQARLQEYGLQEYGGGQLLIEERVECGKNFYTADGIDPALWGDTPPVTHIPRSTCWGHVDVGIIGGGYLEIVDFKNGVHYVEEENNTQTLLYALGALRLTTPGTVQRVRLTIAQPRATSPDGQVIRTWEIPEAELIEWAVRLGDAAVATEASDAPRVPGETQCRYCPAKPVCPEVSGAAVAGLTGNEMTIPTEHVATLDTGLVDALTRSPDQLTAQQRARVLDAEPLIRSWLSAIHEYALACAMRGEPTPGFKVVDGRKSRKWALDEEQMAERLSRSNRIGGDGKTTGKLRKEHYMDTKILSPAQAEKRIRPLVTSRTWANIESLIKTEGGKPTLAPETDPRPALTIRSGAEVFGLPEKPEETDTVDFL